MIPSDLQNKPTLTIKEFCRCLGMTRATYDRHMRQGHFVNIPRFKKYPGAKSFAYKREDVEAFLENQEKEYAA